MSIIADTGAIYALIDASDAWHERMIDWWRNADAQVLLPLTIVPEVSYLLQTRIGANAEARFVRALAEEEFELDLLEPDDVRRASEIVTAYSKLPLGFVDATVVAVAERNDAREILTTDRRHFSIIKPLHAKRFSLLP